ncbi:hypothetical protein CRG98_020581 [Punica granatum]|uniref:Uncharacterized protein n=1 Tax=Punica granatum TaxID=22663 RepID=A0A2I0JT14_PUNGR|nr:hypothetical protein CRG98_020581 [Punica granatum]
MGGCVPLTASCWDRRNGVTQQTTFLAFYTEDTVAFAFYNEGPLTFYSVGTLHICLGTMTIVFYNGGSWHSLSTTKGLSLSTPIDLIISASRFMTFSFYSDGDFYSESPLAFYSDEIPYIKGHNKLDVQRHSIHNMKRPSPTMRHH